MLLEKRRKQAATVVSTAATRTTDAFQLKQPGPDGAAIALAPPPAPLRVLRTGCRNYEKEGRVGLHMKPEAPYASRPLA